MLLEAARRAGWDAEGVEISAASVKHVESLGFKVFCGELTEAKFPDNYFDVVTASEVLEHVPDPLTIVAEIARVLRPGGLLWMTTPHGRGLGARNLGLRWKPVAPPDHLQLFSVRGVKRMLYAAGFRRVHVTTHGANPFEIVARFRRTPGSPGINTSLQPAVSSRHLNEAITRSPARRILKKVVNGLLGVSHLGDSLKIYAEK